MKRKPLVRCSVFDQSNASCWRRLWDIDTAEFAAFRVDIDVAASDMFNFKLDEFMDPGAGGGEKVDDEIPVEIPSRFREFKR